MNRSEHIQLLCEDHRGAFQVLITPDENGVQVRFNDDTLGNHDLRFPKVYMNHDDFFKVIPHNDMTTATFQNALERGDTYGIFVSQTVISDLARIGTPNTAARYQHTHIRRHETTDDFNRYQMMNARV